MKIEIKCPRCGSTNINQYRMTTGPIWCAECGFRAEHKEIENPFERRTSIYADNSLKINSNVVDIINDNFWDITNSKPIEDIDKLIEKECTAYSGSCPYCGRKCGACDVTGLEYSKDEIIKVLRAELARLQQKIKELEK
jgi:uncharacterized Zn finger protein (UPF0148 family)